MVDIVIAIALALLTLATSYIGVHLTVSPAKDEQKTAFKAAILVIGFLSVALIGLQAWRNVDSGRELKQFLKEQNDEMKAALRDEGRRPIQVKFPAQTSSKMGVPAVPSENPKIDPVVQKNTQFKIKATQLSAEILEFLSDRERSGLSNFSPKPPFPETGESIESLKQRWDAELKRYNEFRSDTMSRYNSYFGDRAVLLLSEMRSSGIDVQRAYYRPTTPESVHQFALDLAAVASHIQ